MTEARMFTAFGGERLIVSGKVEDVLLATKAHLEGGGTEPVLIFEDGTGRQVDFDFRGTEGEVLARLGSHPLFQGAEAVVRKPGPGRPHLGVVSREVSLLPRHWDWLEGQRGGISVTLRRLVDEERKRRGSKDAAQAARDAAGKFMWAMAGNCPGFEEASRALYAGDRARLETAMAAWPADIREHVGRLLAVAEGLEQGEIAE